MRKYVNLSFIFALLGLASGVFYREFTKFNDFEGTTALAFGHVHFLVLGAIVLLLVGIVNDRWDLERFASFAWFERLYLVGLPFMIVMFYVRGILQVLGTELGSGADAAISGIAGLAHILVGAGIVALYLAMRKAFPKEA